MKNLKLEKRWGIWKRIINKDGKVSKVPFRNLKQPASSNDQNTWIEYETANQLLSNNPRNVAGLSFFLRPFEPFEKEATVSLCGIDIDAHDAEKNDIAEEILQLFENTYAERSPSGKGYHIICYVHTQALFTEEFNLDNYRMRNDEYELEVYVGANTNRYFTYTGDMVSASDTITDQTENVIKILKKYMTQREQKQKHQGKILSSGVQTLKPIPIEKEEILELLERARRSKNGEKFIKLYDQGDWSDYKENKQSAADLALCGMLCYWLGPNPEAIDEAFRGSALFRDKWDRKLRDSTYGMETIRKAIKSSDGEYYSSQSMIQYAMRRNNAANAEEKMEEEETESSSEAVKDDDSGVVVFSDEYGSKEEFFKKWRERRPREKTAKDILTNAEIFKVTDPDIVRQFLKQLRIATRREKTPPILANAYREIILSVMKTNDLSRPLKDIFNRISMNKEAEGIAIVQPIMCGLGKSTAISHKIFEVLDSDDNDGLLIITDRKSRLDNYIHQTNRYPAMTAFFDEHRDDICVLTGETMEEELPRQHYCKVLLMTTQHFYNLPLEEVQKLTTWGEEEYPRSLIFFDEDPEVARIIEISRDDLDQVTTAIGEGLPASDRFAESKQFCKDFWNRVVGVFTKVSEELDVKYKGKAFCYFHTFETLDPYELERFQSLINDHTGDLNYRRRKNEEGIEIKIKKTIQLLGSTALVCSRDDTSSQKTSFSILEDRTPHIKALATEHTRVLILDATAHISPNYELHPDFFQEYGMPHDHGLPTLNLHTFNMSCGSSTLKKMKAPEMKQFVSAIKELALTYNTGDPKKIGLFTYKSIQEKFYTEFEEKYVEHFENIVGKNDFMELDEIVQVGLNHFTPEKYILYKMALQPDFAEQLLASSPEEQNTLVQSEGKRKQSDTWNIIARFICADIEQNVFRGSIRSYDLFDSLGNIEEDNENSEDDSSEDMDIEEHGDEDDDEFLQIPELEEKSPKNEYHYLLCYSSEFYPMIFPMLYQRFTPLGGKVTQEINLAVLAQEYMKKLRKQGIEYEGTNAYKLIHGLRVLDVNRVYSAQEVKSAAGLTENQFRGLQKIPFINCLLSEIRTGFGKYLVGSLFTLDELRDF